MHLINRAVKTEVYDREGQMAGPWKCPRLDLNLAPHGQVRTVALIWYRLEPLFSIGLVQNGPSPSPGKSVYTYLCSLARTGTCSAKFQFFCSLCFYVFMFFMYAGCVSAV